MSASDLINLAIKLKLNDMDSSEYMDTFITCVTTSNEKKFIVPISSEAQIKVLDQIDWINQGGSDSKLEQIDKGISGSFMNGVTPKVRPSETYAPFKVTKYRGDISKKSKSIIIGIINDKLTEQVKKNMVGPRLVNRTGTFASSARVMDIKQTPQGFLSLVYTWQASPYSVFSKYYGKLPWATPERDPDELVILSIQQLIVKYYQDRIYYRRYW